MANGDPRQQQGPPPEEEKPRRRRKIAPKEQKVDEPPLTPFIDIIFQVLIFFLLTMKFRQKEGHLLSLLPKDKGLFSTPVDSPELNEVRIYICADSVNRRMDQHLGYKEKHQDFNRELKQAGHPIGDICYVQLELNFNDQKQVFKTEKYPGKWGHNQMIYNTYSDQVKVMLDSVRAKYDPTKPAPTILDIDGNVPYEHAIGFLNALQKRKITGIEWAGNPRFDRYFGPISR
jgi:biopolymer transport protein ExbD